LTEAVKRLIDEGRKSAYDARGKKLAAAGLAMIEQAKSDATLGWDASPASKPRRGPPRPSSSSAKFASSAPPSTPPPNWPNSMPISSAKRSR
jgi:hypothetical protein